MGFFSIPALLFVKSVSLGSWLRDFVLFDKPISMKLSSISELFSDSWKFLVLNVLLEI